MARRKATRLGASSCRSSSLHRGLFGSRPENQVGVRSQTFSCSLCRAEACCGRVFGCEKLPRASWGWRWWGRGRKNPVARSSKFRRSPTEPPPPLVVVVVQWTRATECGGSKRLAGWMQPRRMVVSRSTSSSSLLAPPPATRADSRHGSAT